MAANLAIPGTARHTGRLDAKSGMAADPGISSRWQQRELGLFDYHCQGLARRPGRANHLLAQSTYAVVLAGGRGSRLHQLTDDCAKPAVPFAGQLAIIDFALSNCVNSGVRRIGVLTQYRAQSLIRHINRGWGFLDAGLAEFVDIIPAQQKIDDGWYTGTANAVYQNLDMLSEADPRLVLVLAGDHVYKMDYTRILEDHVTRAADLTVACVEVPVAQASAFGVLQVNAQGRVVDFQEKPQRPATLPGDPTQSLASMGVYVFSANFLRQVLASDAADASSSHDFGRDILPRAVAQARVMAHNFGESCVNMVGNRPYWRDVGTLDAYWDANMDLIRNVPELNLYDHAWPIRSLQRQLPPAHFACDEAGHSGMAVDSMVASGCIVSGATVRRSVLFSKVRVGDGSLVEDSLLLPNVVVGHHTVVRRAIISKHCVLPDGIHIGVDEAEDRARFTVTDQGVTLVTPQMLAN